jgi:hypothetical protein
MELNSVLGEARRYRSDDGRYDLLGAVADQQARADPLAVKHESGVRGNVGGELAVDGIGQVVPESHDDTALVAEAEDDKAPARVETEQVRNDSEHCVRGRRSQLNFRGKSGRPGRGCSAGRTRGAVTRRLEVSHGVQHENRPAAPTAGYRGLWAARQRGAQRAKFALTGRPPWCPLIS